MVADLEAADYKVQRAVELLGKVASELSTGDPVHTSEAEAKSLEFMALIKEVHATVVTAIIADAKPVPTSLST
jgi:hypothetical protein